MTTSRKMRAKNWVLTAAVLGAACLSAGVLSPSAAHAAGGYYGRIVIGTPYYGYRTHHRVSPYVYGRSRHLIHHNLRVAPGYRYYGTHVQPRRIYHYGAPQVHIHKRIIH